MLKSLDVLIGLTVVMLVLSMGVTMLTQFATTVLNSRGRHLKRGIVDLLNQLDPALAKKIGAAEQSIAGRIADAVLTHPLISSTGRSLGTVVHREELTRLLLYFADDSATLDQDVKAELRQALVRNGISDPAGTLKRIRDLSVQLETEHPRMAIDLRQTIAILHEARSDFVAKINNSFDQAIDRVAERFTASTRAITFVAGLLVAVALQVDVVDLVNRLAADDMLRQAFVTEAASLQGAVSTGSFAQPADAGTTSAVSPRPAAPAADAIDVKYMAFLADNGLIAVARTRSQWVKRWGAINFVGVLITSLLLSLGAPFWYTALGRLLQLRSILAAKDDEQRNARQAPGAATSSASPP